MLLMNCLGNSHGKRPQWNDDNDYPRKSHRGRPDKDSDEDDNKWSRPGKSHGRPDKDSDEEQRPSKGIITQNLHFQSEQNALNL
jgi:hypothetical protein